MTTDDDKIIEIVEKGMGFMFRLNVQRNLRQIQPEHMKYCFMLSIFMRKEVRFLDVVLLLQVTSPFRMSKHIEEAFKLYTKNLDMVVSVKETDSNPYYLCFEDDAQGMLHISKGDGLLYSSSRLSSCI